MEGQPERGLKVAAVVRGGVLLLLDNCKRPVGAKKSFGLSKLPRTGFAPLTPRPLCPDENCFGQEFFHLCQRLNPKNRSLHFLPWCPPLSPARVH